ncbi:aspartic proteinase CDR1 [Trifolium repens]|nr:aspartic proteinase CDR1 [Trifolium repens]
MSHFSFFTFILFCLSCLTTLSHALNNSFSVELIHRDSFKSPLYHPTETKFQRIFNAVHRSINRANHFSKKISSCNNNYVSTLTPDIVGDYLMSYSIGTPPFKVYGSFDTGSDFVWLQCKPCNICYNQTSPIFNPSKSSSYKKIPCSSKTCKSMNNISCSHDDDSCEYTYGYGDGSYSQGDLSVETLTLDFTSGSSVSFPKFIIGCGHTNNLSYSSGHNFGIIGFGAGPLSLINQISSSIGRKFSYCLIGEFDKRSNLSSKLNFGDAAIVSGDKVVSTPIVGRTSYYQITLEAFSVGNKRIRFDGSKREGTNVSTQTIVIDSGTTVTILPHQFYTMLESVVAEAVKLERVIDRTSSFNLCYNVTSKQSNFPVITAHFSGADVKLDSKGTFVKIDEGVECFAFRPSRYGSAIFGNLSQKNLLVGFDLKNSVVSFKPTDCTKY